jgi:hypothetical protein
MIRGKQSSGTNVRGFSVSKFCNSAAYCAALESRPEGAVLRERRITPSGLGPTANPPYASRRVVNEVPQCHGEHLAETGVL